MRYLRWLLVLSVIVGGGAWIVLASPSFQDCIENGGPAQDANPEKEKPPVLAIASGDYVGCSWRFAKESAEPLIAIFTVVLGLGTLAIVFLTGDIVVAGEASSRRQLRAWVGVEKLTLESPNLGAKTYQANIVREAGKGTSDRIDVIMKNFGLTPANRVHVFVNWQPMGPNERLPEDFRYPDNLPEFDHVTGLRPTWSIQSIFPGQTKTQSVGIDDLGPFRRSASGNISLYVYGHIDYFDVFGRKGTTTFCYSCKPHVIVNGGGRGVADFDNYEQHNEAK